MIFGSGSLTNLGNPDTSLPIFLTSQTLEMEQSRIRYARVQEEREDCLQVSGSWCLMRRVATTRRNAKL